jgi:hypothetical protein
VTVDTAVLHGILKRIAKFMGYKYSKMLEDFFGDKRAQWERSCDLTKAEGETIDASSNKW